MGSSAAIFWIGWWLLKIVYGKREDGKGKAIAEGTTIPPEDFPNSARQIENTR